MEKSKDVTIYDLAESLNLSIATVSRALKNDPVVNPRTRHRITELAEKLGYRTNHFAKNLRTRKTNTIGVIIPRLNSYFMSTVIAGMESVANQSGYNLIISQSAESFSKEIECAKTMFNNRVDGLLVSLAYDTAGLNHFDSFIKKQVPVIFFDRSDNQPSYTSIVLDNERAGYDATHHLIGQGCKRIVHITADTSRSIYVSRLNGYKKALAEADIPFDQNLIIHSNLSMENGFLAADKILAMDPRPDGIFVANDNCAVSVILRLKEKGIRIPEDIAVVGFNNDPVSTVSQPNLSTINYPGYKMGEVAAKHLIDLLKGTHSASQNEIIVLHHKLMVRGSSNRK